MFRPVGAATLAVAVLTVGLTGIAPALGADVPDSMPTQGQLDQAAADFPGSYSGGWGDATGGVAARPFIKNLSIINGDVRTPVIVDGLAGQVPASVGGTDLTAVVVPINVCKPPAVPASGQCYASPNRVQVSLAYDVAGQLHTDLSRRSEAAQPSVTASSVVDIEIGLNQTGSSLGWTWATGAPTFWDTTGLGGADATARLQFRPGLKPQMANWSGAESCSTIPVSTCDLTQSEADFLSAEMLLSLDDTLGAQFAGSLFATEGAVIGSLETGQTDTGPSLTYGAASSHLTPAGAERRGTIRGFLSDAALAYFGISGDPSGTLDVQRTNGTGTTGAVTWSRWTDADQGTAGWLVTIPDISFSAPKYVVAKESGGGGSTPQGKPTVKAKAKKKDVLKVDVNPDLTGSANWKLKVQKQVKRNKWRTVARGSTTGTAETYSRDLSKGVYRVHVPAQSGYLAGQSKSVAIKR